MKIGLSYSRCVRDIIDGKVDIDDVLVIISSTNFDPNNDDEWKEVWDGYGGGGYLGNPFSQSEWINYSNEDEDRVRSVSLQLWNDGKLHQPRKFGAHTKRSYHHWREVVLMDEELDQNPAARNAWEKFKMIADLTNIQVRPT